MTLVLAACFEGSAVVAADRRVTLVANNEVVGIDQNDKLFVHDRFVVATFGNGPPDSVPRAMALLSQDATSVDDLGARLLNRFGGTVGMGALVAGVQSGAPMLLEIDFERRLAIPLTPDRCELVARGQYAGGHRLLSDTIEPAVAELLEILRSCAAQNCFVGPPFDVAVIRPEGPVRFRRVDV